MKRILVVFFGVLFSLINYCSAEISVTPVPSVIIYGSTTSGQYVPVKVDTNGIVQTNGGSGAGTITSNMYGWEGVEWQKLRVSDAGYLLLRNSEPTQLRVEATIPQMTNERLNISKMSGLSSIIYTSISTVTNQQIIAPVVGQTLYIYGITFFNRGITKGSVNFYWDAGTTLCYPAYCPAESGFGDSDMYRVSSSGQGLYVTTPDACAITVYYLQKY